MLTPDALAELMAGETPRTPCSTFRERGAYDRGHIFRSHVIAAPPARDTPAGAGTAPATPMRSRRRGRHAAPLAGHATSARWATATCACSTAVSPPGAKAGRGVVQGPQRASKVLRASVHSHEMKTTAGPPPRSPQADRARRRHGDRRIAHGGGIHPRLHPGARSAFPAAELVPRIGEWSSVRSDHRCQMRRPARASTSAPRRCVACAARNPSWTGETRCTMAGSSPGLTLKARRHARGAGPGAEGPALAETTARRVADEMASGSCQRGGCAGAVGGSRR